MGEDLKIDAAMDECTVNDELSILPLFHVHVQGAVKHGESVMFTIEVQKAQSENVIIILREYEDFEWLHHNILNSSTIGGIIVPPLPVKSLSDPKSAENLSKKQLGNQTKVLKGDQFDVDIKTISIYLKHMLNHPFFGRNKNLIDFLDVEEAPVKARLSKGWMTKLSSAIDNARKGSLKDRDDYFNEQRQFSNDFNKVSKEFMMNFNKLQLSQWRLSSCYRTVVTDLTTCTAERDEGLIKLNKVLRVLGDGMEDEAASWELRSTQEENGIGCYLDLMARYSDTIKEMHYRRLKAMIEFTLSEKALEKAKPLKRPVAEEAFEAAKSNYEKITHQGKDEIQGFTQMRLKLSEETLSSHAEIQIKISQDFYTQLFHTRKTLLELSL